MIVLSHHCRCFGFATAKIIRVGIYLLLILSFCAASRRSDSDVTTYSYYKDGRWYESNAIHEQQQQQQQQVTTDPKLDCGMRCLFWEKAQSAIPWRKDNQDIEEALDLIHSDQCICNSTGNEEDPTSVFKRSGQKTIHNRVEQRKSRRGLLQGQGHSSSTVHEDKTNYYLKVVHVSPKYGHDRFDHPGNRTHPFRTLQFAVDWTREWRKQKRYSHNRTVQSHKHKDTTIAKIVLHAGIHFLNQTLVLTPEDSNMLFRGRSGSWISGGVKIPADGAGWRSVPNAASNIWVADNLTSLLPHRILRSNSFFSGLFTVDPHTRLTLARFPNANVEIWNARDRYQDPIGGHDASHWMFLPYTGVPTFDFYNLTDPQNPTGVMKTDSTMGPYNMFGTGQGGACAQIWGTDPSYWCSNISAGGWAFVDAAAAKAGRMNFPAGVQLAATNISSGNDADAFQQRVRHLWHSQKARGAIFHVAHTQGWAWHMFNVSHIDFNDDNTTTIHFDKGGWQGGRNWQCKDKDGQLSDCTGDGKKLDGGPWYVEGILQELDAPGEFYWDEATEKLYLYPDCGERNGDTTGTIYVCAPTDLIGTNLQTLIKIQGTQQNPAQNIRWEGIGFRDAAKTYMEQWGAPSGGDWALHRGGAFHLEGTENVTFTDCQFRRLDGNAIFLGAYNRHTTVARSDFSWLGEGAMATWGDTINGYDATGGAQPRFSVIENNVMSNLGLYQKQSSAWGQNKACQNIIRNNVMFNLPRAAINFNDGLGGGNLIEGNVIFHTCRESGDHGDINSWDRMPFLADTTGKPSFAALPTHAQGNLIWGDFAASQGFDNDDGSSFYYTHDNVFYQADGFKMDYGGHSSKFYNNLVYADGGKSCYGTGSFLEGQADTFETNTCIVARSRRNGERPFIRIEDDISPQLGHLFQCSLIGMNPVRNRYYTTTGNGTFACGNQDKLTLQDMQQQGYEMGSLVNVIPSASTILQWVRDTLAIQNEKLNETKPEFMYAG